MSDTLEMELLPKRRAPMAGRAVVAATRGRGVVLWHDGVLEALMEGSNGPGSQLDDLGLDDAPDGISIWEGAILGGQWQHGTEDYADIYPEGAFRVPAPEEWMAISNNRPPWPVPVSELEPPEPDEPPNAL